MGGHVKGESAVKRIPYRSLRFFVITVLFLLVTLALAAVGIFLYRNTSYDLFNALQQSLADRQELLNSEIETETSLISTGFNLLAENPVIQANLNPDSGAYRRHSAAERRKAIEEQCGYITVINYLWHIGAINGVYIFVRNQVGAAFPASTGATGEPPLLSRVPSGNEMLIEVPVSRDDSIYFAQNI
jgi:hypothetical protein